MTALDGVLRRLGGTAKAWRTDRMATVVYPGTDRLRPEAAALAKHYGVDVAICPAYRPQRKGVVESGIGYLARSWWRSAPVASAAQAQADLDRFCATVADARRRPGGTVGSLADAESLLSLPASPFPAELSVERTVDAKALVNFPTELLNQDVKTNALGRRRPRDQDELIDDTRSYLRSTQRRPHLVANYFDEEHVTYAKAA